MARIRKQLYNLTIKDLQRHPIWVFCRDEECESGQDEATLKPWEQEPPFDPARGPGIVRCDFWLADGTHAVGYLTADVPQYPGISHLQPTIVTRRTQVSFWFGIAKPDAERLREDYQFLGKDRSQVFPVQYQSAVEISTGPISGVIEGFHYFVSFPDQTIGAVS